MKILKALLVLSTFIGGQVFAGAIFDFRSDILSNSKYSDANNNDVRAQSYFVISRARFRMSGNFNETLSYDARMNLLNATDTKGDDGASKFLNFAQLSQKIDDANVLTFGKLADLGIGGWEGQTSTGDMYMTSMSFYQPYLVGGRFDAKMDSHSLTVYLVNGGEAGSSSNPIASDKTQTRVGTGVTYKGGFAEKTINLIASLHSLPTPAAASAPYQDQNNNYAAVGLQYKTDVLNASLDLVGNTYTGQGTLANTDATKNSAVLTAKYIVGNWIPTLKLDSSTIKNVAGVANGYYESDNAATSSSSPTKLYGVTLPNTTAYTNTVTQVALGTEYKPKMDENFRYHLMLVSKATTFDSSIATANNKVSEVKVIAGVRILADILK